MDVRFRIQPQGEKTIPKMKIPGVRREVRTHSTVCLGMVSVVAALYARKKSLLYLSVQMVCVSRVVLL